MHYPSAQSSAISRLPTEILQDIFDFVLSTWLLPGDGSNLFHDLWLFHSGCFSYKEYWRIVHLWRALRSTCRQWYCLLECQTVPLATTNLDLYLYPKPIGSPAIQRLETYSKHSCWNFCNRMCGQCMVRAEIEHPSVVKQDQKIRRWSTSSDFTQMDRLQVFIHQGDRSLQADPNILTALYHAPLLRAISTYNSLYNHANPMPSALTHLHLQCTLDTLPQLQLPLLKYLHLSMECRPEWEIYSQSTPFSFSSWALPVLVTLRLNGEISEEEGELVRELVLKCSRTVVNLVLDLAILEPGSLFGAKGAPLSVVYPVLHLCPHLTVLGLFMSHLMHRTLIPPLPASSHYLHSLDHSQPSARSLSLLILGMSGFSEINYNNREAFEENLMNSGVLGVFGRSEGESPSWSLERVIIPYTWSDLGAIWAERRQNGMQDSHEPVASHFHDPAEQAWVLLSHFIDKKVPVFDADGIELHDEKGEGMVIFNPFV